jgi:hypothetical protein
VAAGSVTRLVCPRAFGSARPPSVIRPVIGATTPLVRMSASHGPLGGAPKIDAS